MGKRIRSARGEVLDFDLLKIKEQIATAPAPQDVKRRQDFIERRLRRKLKKVVPEPAPAIPQKVSQVDKSLPKTEQLTEEPKLIDEMMETDKSATEPAVKTKQGRRPSKKPTDDIDKKEENADG